MTNEIRKLLSVVFCLSTLLALSGCEKRSGHAVVILKEHIPARAKGPSPAGEMAKRPKSERSEEKPGINEEKETDRDDGTVTVDGHVMKREVRGTGQDPRARNHEQWIVTVRLTDIGNSFSVQTDRAQFEKLNVSDVVQVIYRVV